MTIITVIIFSDEEAETLKEKCLLKVSGLAKLRENV